jgi:anaerobic ribonucleoside-triphosphate reductase activating protein
MTTEIAISRIHFPVTKLGPGRRVGIWMQGCSIRCPGCISVDTWARGHGRTSVMEVLEAIAPWISIADGFTISGGEPFDQPDALTALLTDIRKLSAADILVFTGHPLEAIGPQLSSMDGLIDALIADPFDETAPQTLALRGSDNQRLVLFTALGRARFANYERRADAGDRAVDVMFDDNGEVWLAGIPARDDFRRLQHLLRETGAAVAISQDRSGSTGAGAAPK